MTHHVYASIPSHAFLWQVFAFLERWLPTQTWPSHVDKTKSKFDSSSPVDQCSETFELLVITWH